jgi:hypothetical protein
MNAEKEQKAYVDPANLRFAKTMEALTLIGLAAFVVVGILYFSGIHDLDSLRTVTQNWNRPSADFWSVTTGANIGGVGWFMSHWSFSDALCMLCVGFLALVPFFSIALTLPKALRRYKVVFAILTIEFAVIIIWSLMVGGGGVG